MKYCIKTLCLLLFLALINNSYASEHASATLVDPSGKEVGNVKITGIPNGVHLSIQVHDLPPGVHGFHVHETGVCEPEKNFTTAGGHFNPDSKDHGWYFETGPHAGDLPNIHVGSNGSLSVEYFTTSLSLAPNAAASLLDGDGSAIVIHNAADDYQSQPSGDAGNRIACGVIKEK